MFGGGRSDVCIAERLLTVISSDHLFGLNIYVGILNFYISQYLLTEVAAKIPDSTC